MRKRSKWATEQPQAVPAVRVQRSASRRVLGSSLRVTAEKPLHGQHGFGIMATRQMRLRLRSGIYAARDVARPDASASRARVESGLKDGGIASPRNITTTSQTRRRREIFACRKDVFQDIALYYVVIARLSPRVIKVK